METLSIAIQRGNKTSKTALVMAAYLTKLFVNYFNTRNLTLIIKERTS